MSRPDDDDDDTASYTSASSRQDLQKSPDSNAQVRYSPEEEASLLAQSNELKLSANAAFGNASYTQAIQLYSRAQAKLAAYMTFELAVLYSNTAACHVKLQEWDQAITAATKCLDDLESIDPVPRSAKGASDIQEVDDSIEAKIAELLKSGHTHAQVQKIRTKAMLRRASAQTHVGTWSALQAAEQDYTYLNSLSEIELTKLDRQTAQRESRLLAPRLEDAKQKEMAEMMDKLKGLGNSILKPFGLSTNNFNFVKDQASGNYNMNFSQEQK